MRQILYLAWIGFDNLGDEIMWKAFQETAQQYLGTHSLKITPSLPGVDYQNPDLFDSIVVGGGSLLVPEYIRIAQQFVERKKPIVIWGSGTDWLSRKQLEQVLDPNVHSMQLFSADIDQKLKEIIEAAIYVGVRGPLTHRALSSLGGNVDNVVVCGDPAFLLSSDVGNADRMSLNLWSSEERVVGVNWGTSYNRIYGENEESVENALALVCKELIQSGYKVYMYYVWGPDEWPTVRLYKKIGDATNVRVAPRMLNHDELLHVMREWVFTVNYKLHASILSSITKTPFVALGYRFKVFDFAHSTGLADYVVPTDSRNLVQNILDVGMRCTNNKASIEAITTQHTVQYRQTLQEPFNGALKSLLRPSI